MNSMLSLAVGVCGLAFAGYCIYFDSKRRSDPNFKKKLRERRKAAKIARAAENESQIPQTSDSNAMYKFFLDEVYLGEEMLAMGNIAIGVQHLANAVTVCSNPQQLLNVLNNTLPPAVFDSLIQHIKLAGKQPKQRGFNPQILGMAEDDVE